MASVVCGIDIGDRFVRAVRLRNTKKGWQWLKEARVDKHDADGELRSLQSVLGELKATGVLKGASVTIADSDMTVMVRYLHQVPLPEDRLRKGITLELSSHADESGNLAADYTVLPIDGDDIVVCCALAQPDEVEALLSVCKEVDITVGAIGLHTTAAANALRVHLPEGSDEDMSLFMEVGARGTRLVLLRNGQAIACRNIALGGFHFTEALADTKGLLFGEAEASKLRGLGTSVVPEVTSNNNASLKPIDQNFDTDEDALFLDDEGTVQHKEVSEKKDDPLAHDSDDLFADDISDVGIFEDTEVSELRLSEGKEVAALDDLFADDERPAVNLPSSSVKDLGQDILLEPEFLEGAEEQAEKTAPITHTPVDEDDLFAEELETPVKDESVVQPGMQTMIQGRDEMGEELRQIAENLYRQTSSSINYFKSQLHMPRLVINRVVLTGGGAELRGLAHYLQHRFSVPVIAPAVEELYIQNGVIPESPSEWFTAAGLALGDYNVDGIHVDLRSQRYLRAYILRTHIRWPRIAASIVLVACIILGVSLSLQNSAGHAVKQSHEDYNVLYKKGSAELQTQRTESDGFKEDLLGIAARLYAGRDLLYTIRALKEVSPNELWITKLETEGLSQDRSQDGIESTDTTVSRGSLYLNGRMKPEINAINMRNTFDEWKLRLARWHMPALGGLLFDETTLHELHFNHDTETNQADFRVRFDYKPADLGSMLHAETLDSGQVQP